MPNTYVRKGKGKEIHWGEIGRSRTACGQTPGGSKHYSVNVKAYGATKVTCERCKKNMKG